MLVTKRFDSQWCGESKGEGSSPKSIIYMKPAGLS